MDTLPPAAPARDRYIPVRFDELRDAAAAEIFPAERETLVRCSWLLENLFEFRMGEMEESLKEAYLPFCPDDACVTRRAITPAEREGSRARFWREFDALLERANYTKMTREAFQAEVDAGTSKGLTVVVDLDQYEDFAFYHRGRGSTTRQVRGLKTRLKKKDMELPVFLRAVIVTRMKGSPHLQLRLFKEVPVEDVEFLLPGTKLRMRFFDKLKLTGGGGAAVYSAVKTAFQGAVAVGKFFLWPLVLVFGIGYLGRVVWRFFKIRDDYHKNLIKDLFFLALDSNLGVINRLVDSTEEEEAKEAFLAYVFALARGPLSPAALKEAVESWLRAGWGVEAEFDLDDAVAKIGGLGLVEEADGVLVAAPLDRALDQLDYAWDSIYDARSTRGEKA